MPRSLFNLLNRCDNIMFSLFITQSNADWSIIAFEIVCRGNDVLFGRATQFFICWDIVFKISEASHEFRSPMDVALVALGLKSVLVGALYTMARRQF